MKNEKLDERHLELSSKFLEMGQSLMTEGQKEGDYRITQAGGLLIMISGIILDEKDMYEFCNLSSMFSAKKILTEMGKTDSDMISFLKGDKTSDKDSDINDIVNELIKKIRKGGGQIDPS